MTSLDSHNVPGLVSGDAYITENPYDSDYQMLVLDNATLEWDTNSYGLHNENMSQSGLIINAIGKCSIKVPNAIAAFELDVATVTTVLGGGTLRIKSKGNAFEAWVAAWISVLDNTTVIAESTNASAFYDQDGATIEIDGASTFCARGSNVSEPIYLDSNGGFYLGDDIDVCYPFGAYISGSNIYNSDGTKVKGDWVVIGINNQATQNLIDGVSPLGETEEGGAIYNLSGQRLNKMQKGINIVNGKAVLVK